MEPNYIPGTCNIGRDEIKVRRNNAVLMASISIILATVLLVTGADKLWRLLLVVPLSAFGIGIQQWYNKFCVYFGMKGIFNFGDVGTTSSVELNEMHKKDMAKARRMILFAVLFGVVGTSLFYVVA